MTERALERLLGTHALPAELAVPLRTLLDLLAGPDAPTTVHDPQQALDVHLADSLAALAVPALRAAHRIADMGSGAGLPGLPLALALPDARVQLVESQRRKCEFLQRAVEALGLTNAEVVCARVEELPQRSCDAVTARALASLPVLCEYAAPLLVEGGVLVAWKGAVGAAEDADGLAAARGTRAPARGGARGRALRGLGASHPARPAQGRAHPAGLPPPPRHGRQAAAPSGLIALRPPEGGEIRRSPPYRR